jgi:hypothetical protein
MLNKFSKIILFYFAYLPLFIMLLINNINGIKLLLILCGAFILIGFIFVGLLIKTIKSVVSSEERIEIKELKNSEYLSFLVTYILPFLITFEGVRQVVSSALLFILIAYLYIETSLFCINPLLKIFFRYNVYEVNMGKQKYFLLSKNKHKEGIINLEIKRVGDNFLLE